LSAAKEVAEIAKLWITITSQNFHVKKVSIPIGKQSKRMIESRTYTIQ
jgi:hypothetical protein